MRQTITLYRNYGYDSQEILHTEQTSCPQRVEQWLHVHDMFSFEQISDSEVLYDNGTLHAIIKTEPAS